MKKFRKITAVVVAFVMLLSMVACNTYSPAKEYKNVTLGDLKLDVRSDMEYDNTHKNASGENAEQYYCDYFGVTVTSEKAALYKLEGYNDIAAYLGCVIEANNLDAEVKTSGDRCYMDYKNTVDGVECIYTAYGLELGYSYYMVQFFTVSGDEEKYRAEYEKIMDTVELAETPEETVEVVIDDVKMTVSGDAEEDTSGQYYTGKYTFAAMSEELPGTTAEQFAKIAIQQGGFKTADGEDVTEPTMLDDDIAFYEYVDSDETYFYNYMKTIDSNIVYILFATQTEADDTLKSEMEDIVKNATLA